MKIIVNSFMISYILHFCTREDVGSEGLRGIGGGDSWIVQGKMTFEKADRLSDHARWFISCEGNGVEVDVHVGGVVGVVVGVKCGGEDRNRRLVV